MIRSCERSASSTSSSTNSRGVSLWRRSYAARSTSHSLPELRSPEAGRARCDYRQRRVVALPCAGFGLWLITKYG